MLTRPVANPRSSRLSSRTLPADDSLEHAVALLLSDSQQDFPVVNHNAVVGILTRADLLGALARQGQQLAVADVMRREFPVADASEMIELAFQRLQEHDCHTMPVLRRGNLVGLITMENVGEFISVRAALGGARSWA